MKQLAKGVLITIEGIDGAGKSTAVRQLARLLTKEGIAILTTKEPGGSTLGTHLRTIVQDRTFPICPQAEYLLFAADRAQHMHDVIVPALTAQKLVLSDRMADSSLAYQGYGHGLDLHFIQMINAWSMGEITPALTFFIDVPLAVAQERMKKRSHLSFFEQKEAFLTRVYHGFKEIFAHKKNVYTIDGTLPIEVLADTMHTTVKDWLCQQQLLTHHQ